MNMKLSKLLCNIFFALSLSFSVKADSRDTTQLLANNIGNSSPNTLTRTVVKEANIVYPESLQSHIKESLSYVEKFSNKKREYLIRTYQKGKTFFPKVAAILKRYQLPQELKVLIALESAFNANAVSTAGAVGYWQIMDAAAREYGLQIAVEQNANTKHKKTDERKNFTKSTMAAAKYLRDRRKELNNDLLLIVASYNCGAGNVRKAIRKSGKSNPNFWEIKKYLPAETKAYVMNFIALNVLFENYDKFINNKLVFNSKLIEVPVSDNAGRLNTSITD